MSTISQCVLGKNFTSLNLTDTTEFVVTLAGLKFSYDVRHQRPFFFSTVGNLRLETTYRNRLLQALMEELSVIGEPHQAAMESFKNGEIFFISYVQVNEK